MERPLDGVRVLDCGIYHAGPGGLAILGDLGAEVIKLEMPVTGDPMRLLGSVGSIPLEMTGGRNIFFEGANRNKKSVTVDLHTSGGREILGRLVRKSDVFLTNMRRQAVKKLDISYPVLKEMNPRLIYTSVSAFGSAGPDRDRGGFDYQGQARSGLMYSMGEEGTPPVVCQFGIIDQATAIMVSHNILAALYMRERTGMGQEVHVSILGSSMFLQYFNILMTHMMGIEVPRHRRTTEHPMRNYYMCKDERYLMMTLTPPDRHWGPLCRALGQPELETDPRFHTEEKRFANRVELVAIIDQIMIARTLDEWLAVFAEHDLFCCGVNKVSELPEDLQVTQNGYIIDFQHPVLGGVKIPGYPAHFSDCDAGTLSAAPDLGAHTEEVLEEIAGFTREEIARLRQEGAI
jgi:crotonobetainyl-CoA:carnitine CoA-transferase CaiB-like acyl-CoA transferase